MKKMSKSERRIVRAAMAWYRWVSNARNFPMETDVAEFEKADKFRIKIEKACAAHAKSKRR